MKKVFKLFLSMMKIGLFTFGGGYAMISLLENDFVEKKKLIKHDDFMNMIAIAESTPGPIAINSATYIGYKIAKFWGALFATIGVVIPSFVIIFTISLFFNQFLELELVAAAFKGIQVGVVLLILSAGLKMFKKLEKTAFNYVVMFVTIACMIMFSLFSVDFSSIFYILISGFLGYLVYLIKKVKTKKQEEVQE